MTSSGSLKCKTLRQRDYTLYFDKAQHFTKKEVGREFKMKSFLMRFLAFLKFVLTSSPRSLTSVGIQPHWEFKKQVVFFFMPPWYCILLCSVPQHKTQRQLYMNKDRKLNPPKKLPPYGGAKHWQKLHERRWRNGFVLPSSSHASGRYCSAPGQHFSDWASLP